MSWRNNIGLYVQQAVKQVRRDHLKSATLNRDTTKIFNNFTLIV